MSRPTPNILLTKRDSEILVALTLRIRVLSLQQISRTWWQNSVEPIVAVRRRLQQLEASGYLEQITLMAHPEVVVEEPICSWEPGQELPDFGNVAWQLNRRWSSPLVATECVIATHFAGQFFWWAWWTETTACGDDSRLASFGSLPSNDVHTSAASNDMEF